MMRNASVTKIQAFSLSFSFRLSLSILLQPESQAACRGGSTSRATVRNARLDTHGACQLFDDIKLFYQRSRDPSACSVKFTNMLFSVMKMNKNPHRLRLTDAHLHFILTVSTVHSTPNINALAAKKKYQTSGSGTCT